MNRQFPSSDPSDEFHRKCDCGSAAREAPGSSMEMSPKRSAFRLSAVICRDFRWTILQSPVAPADRRIYRGRFALPSMITRDPGSIGKYGLVAGSNGTIRLSSLTYNHSICRSTTEISSRAPNRCWSTRSTVSESWGPGLPSSSDAGFPPCCPHTRRRVVPTS